VLISLGELIEKERLYSGVDKKRGTLIADMDEVSERVQRMISGLEQDVIIEGHFAADIVPKNLVHLIFVLRRSPDELRGLLGERGFKGEKLWENLMAEILDVCLWSAVGRHGTERVCEVDVTGRSVEEVTNNILSILSNEKECRAGFVDWLGKLEGEGKLDEYLEHF